MLLRRLKSNSALNLFFVAVAVVVFWIKNILNPFSYVFFPGEKENILFSPIARFVGDGPLLHVLLSMCLVVGLAFLMQQLSDRYSFIRIRSKLPSSLFIIILGGFVEIHTLHPVYFGAFFLLFALFRLFAMFEQSKPWSAVFDVGFLLGVSSLFYFNLIILFPAFLLGIIILSRELSWRLLVILLLGFSLPFAFVVCYGLLTDHIQEILQVFGQNMFTPVNHFRSNIPLQGYLTVLVLFTLTGSIDILMQYDKKKISSRKYFTVFFWIFIFSMISFAFVPGTSQEMLVIVAIPFTFLIANFFVFMKSRFWCEFLFSLLLSIVILMQFADQLF